MTDKSNVGSLGLPLQPIEGSELHIDVDMDDLQSEVTKFLKNTKEGVRVTEIASTAYQKYKKHEINDLSRGLLPIKERNFVKWFTILANQTTEQEAQDALNTYIKDDQFTAVIALWVSGIEVAERIPLKDGFELVPLKEMPFTFDGYKYSKGDWEIGYTWPKAAITKSIRVEKANRNDGSKFQDEYMDIMDICRLINLIPSLVCAPVLQTLIPIKVPTDSPYHSGGSLFFRHPLLENFTTLNQQQVTELTSLMENWHERDKTTRGVLRRSLYRIVQAKHNQDISDQFLDLAIALEMLLLNDNSNHAQLSLSFRLHGALLLGGDLKQRETTHSMLYELYNRRSAVAHGGTMKKKNRHYTKERKEPVEILLLEFLELGERIVRKVVQDGLPKWSELRLTGGAER